MPNINPRKTFPRPCLWLIIHVVSAWDPALVFPVLPAVEACVFPGRLSAIAFPEAWRSMVRRWVHRNIYFFLQVTFLTVDSIFPDSIQHYSDWVPATFKSWTQDPSPAVREIPYLERSAFRSSRCLQILLFMLQMYLRVLWPLPAWFKACVRFLLVRFSSLLDCPFSFEFIENIPLFTYPASQTIDFPLYKHSLLILSFNCLSLYWKTERKVALIQTRPFRITFWFAPVFSSSFLLIFLKNRYLRTGDASEGQNVLANYRMSLSMGIV